MSVNTVSNFLATHGEDALPKLRQMIEAGEPYERIAEHFGVTKGAVCKWAKKFFTVRILFNEQTERELSWRNRSDLERGLTERKNIRDNSLRLIEGRRRA